MSRIEPEWFGEWFGERFKRPIDYSPGMVVRALSIPESRVYRAISDGSLEAIRTGGRWLIPRPALKKWLLNGYNLN